MAVSPSSSSSGVIEGAVVVTTVIGSLTAELLTTVEVVTGALACAGTPGALTGKLTFGGDAGVAPFVVVFSKWTRLKVSIEGLCECP